MNRNSGVITLLAIWALAGCDLSERSYPLVAAPAEPVQSQPAGCGAREWLAAAMPRLARLLPRDARPPLITDAARAGEPRLVGDLLDGDGRPVDVLAHFDLRGKDLESVWANYDGLRDTARVIGRPRVKPLDWPGFAQVWAPIDERVRLAGLMGWATDEAGKVRDADCIVLVPGLLGDNNILRTRDLAEALRATGHHVLAIELRGHGQTDRRYPEVGYTWGVLETNDLLLVAQWLQGQPHVRRTGLIGFCWGANQALLTAWWESRPADHPGVARPFTERMAPAAPGRCYQAGVIAFSPVLHFERVVELLDVKEYTFLNRPALAGLQVSVRDRARAKGYPSPDSGSLRKLCQSEIARTLPDYPEAWERGLDFLRLLPHRGRGDGDKLRTVRSPTLIVHGANDMLADSQAVAELAARVRNPNVAMLVLPGGGHMGFAGYARDFYYTLIVSFFDATRGPTEVHPGSGD